MDLVCELKGLSAEDWLERVETLADDLGYFEPLGARHNAAFLDGNRTLLVTFEDAAALRAAGGAAEPRGFSFARTHDWSVLALMSEGESWFRDRRIYGYFDRLIDDGFFEDFDRVLFFGADAAGYAAAAFAVAAPGARVLLLRPQATLDPQIAGWDPRYRAARRTSFTDRYGYAPDMIDGAATVHIVTDPYAGLDAMHAALFRKPHVTVLRAPRLGGRLTRSFDDMDITRTLVETAMDDSLTAASFAQLWRRRRDNYAYLRSLLAQIDKAERPRLAARLCRYAAARLDRQPFIDRLEDLRGQGFLNEAAQ